MLSSLPSELVLDIADLLSPYHVSHLACTCSGFYALLKTYLYRRIASDTFTLQEIFLWAVDHSNVKTMQLLFDHGAKLVQFGRRRPRAGLLLVLYLQGFPLIHILTQAVEREHEPSVRVLLDHGADPNVSNEEGLTALMVSVPTRNLRVTRLLLDAGAEVSFWVVARAVESGDVDMLQLLLEKVAAITPRDLLWFQKKALTYAVSEEQFPVMRYLLAGLEALDRRDPFWEEMFHGAAATRRTGSVHTLLEHRAHPGRSGPIMVSRAENEGRWDLLQILRKYGVGKYNATEMARHICDIACQGSVSTMRSLLSDDYPVDARHPISGRTPLSFAAERADLKMVRVLLKAGADPLARDYRGWTTLAWVSGYQRTKVLRALRCHCRGYTVRVTMLDMILDMIDKWTGRFASARRQSIV